MPIIMETTPDGQAVQEQYDYANGQKSTMDGTHKEPSLPAGCTAVCITNPNSVIAYARGDGSNAVAAAANTVPVLPNSWRTIPVHGGLSLIGASGDLFVMPLKGVAT